MDVAITGHRPPKVGGYRTPHAHSEAIKAAALVWFREVHADRVLVGMALGTDQWVAEACYEASIPFIACIPFPGFSSRWPERSRRDYDRLLNRAEQVVVVNQTESYHPGLLQARNVFMVNNCDHLGAIWNGDPNGGTWNCIRYANQARKPFTRIALPEWFWPEARDLERQFSSARNPPSPLLTQILLPGTQQPPMFRQEIMSTWPAVQQQPPPPRDGPWSFGPPPVAPQQQLPQDVPRPEDPPGFRLNGRQRAFRRRQQAAADARARIEQEVTIRLAPTATHIPLTLTVTESKSEPREVIPPERRFMPGRKLDLGDDE